VDDQAALMALIKAVVRADRDEVLRRLAEEPALASARATVGASRADPAQYFLDEVRHYVYTGDTALHFAAARHCAPIVRDVHSAGGQVDAVNRRGARPLHYAVDGDPGSARWDASAQRSTVACLLELGADPNAPDKNGTPPLHRAVRNRCSPAVEALLAGGADRHALNSSGSTVLQLASWTTGRGGTGEAAAKAQQEEVIRLLTTDEAG
jgi:Ankyrin repeats (many copies)